MMMRAGLRWALISWWLVCCVPSVVMADTFQVFDGTLYRNKPDLASYGILPIEILYAARFWPDTRAVDAMERLPDEERVRRVAREARVKHAPVVIDIEHWPLDGGEAQARANLAKYTTVLQWLRNEAPELNFGYFAHLPMPAYGWALKAPASKDYRLWQAENAKRADLASRVDAVYPQLYTYYPDRRAWVRYAVANLREARRYGKPVYAFLWPQYSERNKELGHQYLPADFWRLQLETAARYADGIVIWGGWDSEQWGRAMWDESAPWWQVTREFMDGLARRSPPPVE